MPSLALCGGGVNTPADATAYAKVLLQTTARGAMIAQGLLTATERDNVWHVARVPDAADVVTLSRTTGKLISIGP